MKNEKNSTASKKRPSGSEKHSLRRKEGRPGEEATDYKHFFQNAWFDFYFGLLKRRLEEFRDELLSCSLQTYDKKTLSEEVSGMIEEISEFDIPSPPPGTPNYEMKWERLSITAKFLEQYRDNLDYLFDEDIIYNAPWNDPDGALFVIISADNRFYKNHLLAVYTDLTERLQAAPAGRSASGAETTSATGQAGSGLKHEPGQMEKEIERLKNEIDALKKQRANRAEDDQPEEDQLGQNLTYRMVLLHRLGFLDKKLWSENATQDQISTVLATILSSPKSSAKTATVKRYLKGLVNQDYDGQKIEKKYGPRVGEFLNKAFSSGS